MSYEIIEARREITSALEEAVYDVLGGAAKAAAALKVTKQAVHYLLDQGVVRSLSAAEKIEAATERAGRLVPKAELMNLVPWQGPARHGDGGDRPSGRRPAMVGTKVAARAESARIVREVGATVSELRAKRRRRDTSRSSTRLVGSQAARG